jgi:hypothetical protein
LTSKEQREVQAMRVLEQANPPKAKQVLHALARKLPNLRLA